ncbi:hypothetical protein BIV25_05860 [Streptomyces sp. MUSC 14]|nr:hypothetical protein BIV25_05860 [Streptomyces sp. MUSC 14]
MPSQVLGDDRRDVRSRGAPAFGGGEDADQQGTCGTVSTRAGPGTASGNGELVEADLCVLSDTDGDCAACAGLPGCRTAGSQEVVLGLWALTAKTPTFDPDS